MKRLIPVLVVLFLGYLGFSLALPIFPPLFLDPETSFLPDLTKIQTRRILLGILFSMYPIGQFIGAPMIGAFSDKFGRRPVLLVSLLLIIPTYIGCAISITFHRPLILYLSRFFMGLLEGNITIAQATISDISKTEREKAKNFGWVVSLSSSAFFFGPLLGGILTNSDLIQWFHYDTPFWCSAFLVVIGFAVVFFLFKETCIPDCAIKIHPIHIVSSFIEGLKIKQLRDIFTANLCFFLAIFFFLNFFSAYLVNAFAFNILKLGEVNAYLSLFVFLGPLFFRMMTKAWPAQKIAMIGSFSLGVSFILFLLPHSSYALIGTLVPIGFFMAIGFAYPAILISNIAHPKKQGQALGTNLAIQVFGEGSSALSGGFLLALSNALPVLTGAFIALLGGCLYRNELKKMR